jgi:hypothetical protein
MDFSILSDCSGDLSRVVARSSRVGHVPVFAATIMI